MSYQIGWDTINLRMTERPAHTDYCSNWALVEAVTGVTRDHAESGPRFNERWLMDFVFGTNDGPVPWQERGRTTDMGHAVFLADGSDKREAIECPFHSAEEVLAFDAVEEYGLPDMDELVAYYEQVYQKRQAAFPEVVVPGGYYKTLVSGAIQAFGWDMLLLAAADQKRFDRVLESIYQLALYHYKAWARTSIKVFICHDDMVWSQGAFMHPDLYRRAIFPRYKSLWRVLKEAGKKVLYCSDGKFTEFIDDLVEAGADGLIFEPMTSLEYAIERYGRTHVIVSSKVDCRTLTFGTKEQIKAEIDESLRLGLPCPGFMFAVGNHIPSNVPVENGLFYFDYLTRHWKR